MSRSRSRDRYRKRVRSKTRYKGLYTNDKALRKPAYYSNGHHHYYQQHCTYNDFQYNTNTVYYQPIHSPQYFQYNHYHNHSHNHNHSHSHNHNHSHHHYHTHHHRHQPRSNHHGHHSHHTSHTSHTHHSRSSSQRYSDSVAKSKRNGNGHSRQYHNRPHFAAEPSRVSVNKRHSHQSSQTNDDSSNESETMSEDNNSVNQSEDLEGTVNLKNVSKIYRKRYSIVSKLGQGTFGLVIECLDHKRNIHVAMKIVRSVKRYLDAAEIEVDILNKLDELDVYRNSLIVRLYKSFRCSINDVEHSCLVFEKCGRSLYDYVKKNKYKGFPLPIVGVIGYQLFHSLSFCHLNKLTHTDLKLENILFLSDVYYYNKKAKLYLPTDSFEIRLIDFGGATFESDHHSSVINTRQYRGPEVILGVNWSYPSDIWSIGCILAELYCGELLFATHHDVEHLQLMRKILNVSQFPSHMIKESNVDLVTWPNTACSAKSVKYIEKSKQLNEIVTDGKLLHLIAQCLHIDPRKRITALEAKEHPFFTQFRNITEFQRIFDKLK